MRPLVVAIGTASMLCFGAAVHAEVAVYAGRAFASKGVDIVRLAHRRTLEPGSAGWWPQQLQLGASLWRVPDLGGTTRRYDLNATAIWRANVAWGYIEAGFGPYLLSRTVRNETTSLPSTLQFGSHIGAGWQLAQGARLCVAFQHISNGGLRQPNGGIDFVLVMASVPL
jgi:hypothetical protein